MDQAETDVDVWSGNLCFISGERTENGSTAERDAGN